jgi:hypothetical protein
VKGCHPLNPPSVFAISTQDATLLAAGIAAVASVLIVFLNTATNRGAAMRAAHRSILEPHLGPLGEAIHEIASGAVITYGRATRGEGPANAQVNAKNAAESLKARRPLVKYSLDGLDGPLRVLGYAPDWVATYKGDPTGQKLVDGIQDLAARLDTVIGRSYRRGRPPTWSERRGLERRTKKIRETWGRRFGREPESHS